MGLWGCNRFPFLSVSGGDSSVFVSIGKLCYCLIYSSGRAINALSDGQKKKEAVS